MATEDPHQQRTLGLLGATGVGVGAIVGGGIFVLAGVAYASAGPAAMVAFGLNGLVAFITAMSFAEISSAFPESGGAYTFAKRVLSVRAAFAVGWILWFAYIVAGVLYALGFASFAVLALRGLWEAVDGAAPDWLHSRRVVLLLASGAVVFYALSLIRKTTGGGKWETVGKVVIFVVLIVAGVIALGRQPLADTSEAITPYFSGGAMGLVMAMGFTFIALQGFDLIAAVAGEVKNPGRNIPRAMFLSLGCALVIYLPLLFLVASAGVEPGQSISELAVAEPESVIPLAAERFMGKVGYWLVIVAAILATLSALHANVLAASRVALSMARDRTLPAVLGDLHEQHRTPVIAVYASALTLIAILFVVPSLAAAGAAASLIFLVAFTLAHVTTYLARRRGGTVNAPFKTPWFPLIPIGGGVACAGLALFQAAAVPNAGAIALIWLGLGVILYWSLFARRAGVADAASAAHEPSRMSMRGHSPLVLVPVANPKHAPALVAVANALAPRRVGRVLMLSIVRIRDEAPPGVPAGLDNAQDAIGEALARSFVAGHRPEALITAAQSPLREIERIAAEHKCAAMLLGLGDIPDDAGSPALEDLLNRVDCDVAVMRAPEGWRLERARRVLVPIGGRGDQHELRARVLGSICRDLDRDVTFMTVLPADAPDRELESVRLEVSRLADLKVRGDTHVEIVRAEDAASTIVEAAAEADLVVVGLVDVGRRKKAFGSFALRLAREVPCATIMLSRRRPGAFQLLDPLRDDLVDTLRAGGRATKRR